MIEHFQQIAGDEPHLGVRVVLLIQRSQVAIHLQSQDEVEAVERSRAVRFLCQGDVVRAFERTLLAVQGGEDGADLRRWNGVPTSVDQHLGEHLPGIG